MSENSPNGYKERVDFKESIGIWTDKANRGFDASTQFGIIHYGNKGAHIVPSNPHMEGKFMDIAFIRCSIQVALLGHITPNLRAVAVEIKEDEVNTLFYYDKIPSEKERELASLADTEFLADFPTSVKTDFKIIHLPAPANIPKKDMLVYWRYENS